MTFFEIGTLLAFLVVAFLGARLEDKVRDLQGAVDVLIAMRKKDQ